ncbi:MAG: endo-1,4-beta-xylanase [Opitutales bacterium]
MKKDLKVKGAGGEEWQTFEYTGQDAQPDAWRALAADSDEKIDAVRCRHARWRLVSRSGQPIANQPIRIVQNRSAFDWGFNTWDWMNASQAGTFQTNPMRHRQELFTGLCNTMVALHYWAETTPEDAPISEEYQGEISYEHLDRFVSWCQSRGLRVKGHPLFWQVPKALPKWLLKYDLETRWKFVEVRLRQITSRFRGRISTYDLSNEICWEPVLAHTEERHWPHQEPIEAIVADHVKMMGWVREEDPDACFLLNEYGLVAGSHEPLPVPNQNGEPVTRHQQLERFIAVTEGMIEAGQAPNALGIQTPPGEWSGLEAFDRTIDALGSSGLPVHVSEFRPNQGVVGGIEDRDEREALLGDYIETALRMCFANPHCEAFVFWDTDFFVNGRKPTAIYRRIHNLIQEQWMTRTTATTDAEGYFEFRGFMGDYSIRLGAGRGLRGYAAQLRAGTQPGDEQELMVDFL